MRRGRDRRHGGLGRGGQDRGPAAPSIPGRADRGPAARRGHGRGVRGRRLLLPGGRRVAPLRRAALVPGPRLHPRQDQDRRRATRAGPPARRGGGQAHTHRGPGGRRHERVRRARQPRGRGGSRAPPPVVVRGHLRSARPRDARGRRGELPASDRGGRGALLDGGSQAPRSVRGPAARPGHPPVRSRPLLRDSRIPGHHRVPGRAGVAAPGLLASWRPSLLAAPRGRARARRRRGQSALVRSVRGPPRRGRPREGRAAPPQVAGIGFELKPDLSRLFATLLV